MSLAFQSCGVAETTADYFSSKMMIDDRIMPIPTERCSSSSSSIGRNSDEEEIEEEVQSVYKSSPLEMMDSLEKVLPIRRGISKFYNGKSKSFTALADVSSTNSMKDVIAKPENAYTRRRRNLLAFSHVNRNRSYASGISKRSIGTSRSTLALAVAMSSSESISTSSEDSGSSPCFKSEKLIHTNVVDLNNRTSRRS